MGAPGDDRTPRPALHARRDNGADVSRHLALVDIHQFEYPRLGKAVQVIAVDIGRVLVGETRIAQIGPVLADHGNNLAAAGVEGLDVGRRLFPRFVTRDESARDNAGHADDQDHDDRLGEQAQVRLGPRQGDLEQPRRAAPDKRPDDHQVLRIEVRPDEGTGDAEAEDQQGHGQAESGERIKRAQPPHK